MAKGLMFFGKSSKREIHKVLSYGRRIAIAQVKGADHEIFWVRRFEKAEAAGNGQQAAVASLGLSGRLSADCCLLCALA